MFGFELEDEQKMIRDTVGAFARDEIRPAGRSVDEGASIPTALLGKASELGLVRGLIPEEYGGYGDARSAVTGAVVCEELAYGDLAIALHLMAPRLIALPVMEMGTDEQRKKYLPKFATADFRPASAAIVEPRFDFDTSALTTTARRDGSNYVISGEKCFVPMAAESDEVLVFADLGSSVEAFIVARETKGIRISEREKNMGVKGLATYEVALDQCRVGIDTRLGGEQGINFNRVISQSRVALSAMGVGLMRSAFEYARDYAKERKAFGAPIATKQAIAFILADMAIEIDASRLLVLDAAARLDKAGDSLKESYLARNYVANSALKVTDNAVQVLGGHGYIREHPVEMWLRNARGLSSIEGVAIV